MIWINGGPLDLKIRIFNFPCWEAEINGKSHKIKTEQGTGTVLINISKSEHVLRLRFKDTPVRYYGKMISILTIIALFGFIVFDR